MDPFRAFAALAALAFAAGCSTECQKLAERICGCVLEGPTRDNCDKQVKNELKGGGTDQSFCSQKLDTCADPANDSNMCQRLNTEQGKVDCGLSYPSVDGGVLDVPDGGVPDGGAPDGGAPDAGP